VDTIREQVIKAIIARLQPLTTFPVLRREQYEDEAEFINVWDGDQESEKTKYGTTLHTLEITVEFLKSDAAKPYPESADKMYGELVSAIFNNAGEPDPTLGGLTASMTEASAIILTPDAGLKIIGCGLKVDVVFETQNGNPYSQ